MTDEPFAPLGFLQPPGPTTFKWSFTGWQIAPEFMGQLNVIIGIDWTYTATCTDPELTASVSDHLILMEPKEGAPFTPLSVLQENPVTAEAPAGEGFTALVRIMESQISSAELRRALITVLNMKANPDLSSGEPPVAMA